MNNYFYNIPNSQVLTIVIGISMLIAILCLLAFKEFNILFGSPNVGATNVETYLSLIGVPLGVLLGFVITRVWAAYSDAQLREKEEATKLLLLYNTAADINGGKDVQDKIVDYLKFIIKAEMDY